jgi:hypothetical protein
MRTFHCNVIDDNDDEAEACGKKSVANIMPHFILLGSKPRGCSITVPVDLLFIFDHPPILDFVMTL